MIRFLAQGHPALREHRIHLALFEQQQVFFIAPCLDEFQIDAIALKEFPICMSNHVG